MQPKHGLFLSGKKHSVQFARARPARSEDILAYSPKSLRSHAGALLTPARPCERDHPTHSLALRFLAAPVPHPLLTHPSPPARPWLPSLSATPSPTASSGGSTRTTSCSRSPSTRSPPARRSSSSASPAPSPRPAGPYALSPAPSLPPTLSEISEPFGPCVLGENGLGRFGGRLYGLSWD